MTFSSNRAGGPSRIGGSSGTGHEARESSGLTHVDEHGQAHMVDVLAKPLTRRVAVARCSVHTIADLTAVLADRPGGLDVVEGARFAGIQAAKQTSTLIPLCHPIRIEATTVEIKVETGHVDITAVTEVTERTGVEMEALIACAVSALTLTTVLMAVDPATHIENLTLWHKSGGRSGTWERADAGRRLENRSAVPSGPGVTDS
ncbi:MAG: cyclic pyranopterin monophosphate synthase [Acidimicrobiales bacterium]